MSRILWKKYWRGHRSYRCRDKKTAPITIGMLGSGRGVGTTHLAMLFARYLRMDLGARAAVLECHFHGGFAWMQKEVSETPSAFSWSGVDIYARADVADTALFQDSYRYLIMDFGDEWLVKKEHMENCDVRIIIASDAPWKKPLLKQMQPPGADRNGYFTIINLAIREKLPNQAGGLCCIGFDPLDRGPRKETCSVFKEILERGISCTERNTG